jgi:glycosyltransferase involved in cell wall biosynthesis
VKVLHVHTRYRERGGEDSVVEAERTLLEHSGFEVESLDFQNPSRPLASLSALARSPWNSTASGTVVEKARSWGADVVHIHNTWFILSPAVVSKLNRIGVPVVMTFHNYRLVCANAMLFRDGRPCEDCVGRSPLPGIIHRCYRNSAVSSTMVAVTITTHRRRRTWEESLSVGIALTNFAKERLIAGGLRPERTLVKPNFVTDPGPRLNRPSASDRVLFVGRLSAEKGVGRLVEAWQGGRPEGLELVIVGTGPEESRLRELADSSIRFAGRLAPEDVRKEMLSARALVVPSIWYEGQPMVILEALAAGLPVVHSDLGALAETAGRGGMSLGAGAGTESATRPVLMRLGDDDTVEAVGREARKEYEARFTPERALEGLRGAYELATSREPAGQ